MEYAAQHLYFKHNGTVKGPVSARILHKMFKNNEIEGNAQFSFDGESWYNISKLFTAKLKKFADKVSNVGTGKQPDKKPDKSSFKIKNKAKIQGLSKVMEKAKKAARRLQLTFSIVTAMSFSLGSIAIGAGIISVLRIYSPSMSPLLHIAVGLVPTVLLAAAFAHQFGNFYVYRLSGITLKERHSLALHLPWNRTPKEWPKCFRRWVYCGDWLIEDFSGDLLPYVRTFITGDAPTTIEEELDLWESFMAHTRKTLDFEVGHSVREMAAVESLPKWVREVTPGMNLPELERTLGKAGHDWAVSLLKRAASRKRVFANVDIRGDLHEALFEFHYCRLPEGREGLMVILRPHMKDLPFLEDSISDAA